MSKIVMITGAASGIGLGCARRYASMGCRLILAGRRIGKLSDIAEGLSAEFNTSCIPLRMDVRVLAEVEDAINGLDNDWKDIGILINNAGLALGMQPFYEGDPADWETMIDTNVKGLLYVSRKVAGLMIARGDGHIVNIGSVAGKETYINGNVYCATKFAVDSLTRSMRMELLPHGIRVSQVAPGAVETEFSWVRYKGDAEAASRVYKGFRPLVGDDVASVVAFITSLPSHININDIVVMPTAQANTVHLKRD